MDNELEGRPGNPRLLAAVSCQGAALASALPILLFRRADIAERLDRLGAITAEAALLGAVAVLVALVVPRLRDKLPAGITLMLGGLVTAVGLGLMAWTIELALFIIGGVLMAAGAAPGLVAHRILLTTDARPADRFRTMSWYWGAVAAGASWPLVVLIFGEVGYDTLLWASAALMLVAALWVGRHALAHDEDQEAEVTVARLDVPWARRSYGAAFAVGAVVIGGADAAQSLLLGEWQRSAAQNAAVLAAGTGAAALICLFGPWYHRLHRLGGSRRSDAIGTQLLIAGTLIFLGGLSFTYIGLVVCWLFAGGAIALAAAGLDAAVFPALAPAVRRSVSARQVFWAGAGGLAGFKTGAEGGEFDGDSRAFLNLHPGVNDTAKRLDGLRISLLITVCSATGQGRLTQHVVGKTIMPEAVRHTAPQRLVNSAPHDELIRHDFHSRFQRRAQHRLFEPAEQFAQQVQRCRGISLSGIKELSRQHQSPGRRVHEQGVILPQVLFPIGGFQPVGNQCIRGAGIGYPQQRLG